jgi:hypothetical protein
VDKLVAAPFAFIRVAVGSGTLSMMGALRTSLALLATGLCVVACSALQGLDKFEKCETDEECGLVEGGSDGPVSTDGPVSSDAPVDAPCNDVSNDPNNCGRCGNVCALGFSCSAGSCTCATPRTTCGGAAKGDGGAEGGEAGAEAGAEAGTSAPLSCADLTTDLNNCGACDKACALPNAVAKCAASTCGLVSCTPGFVDCDGNATNGCECPADSCLTAQKQCAKRVFVTSTTYPGNLGGLAGADAKCQARAVAANLPGTYKVWLSDATGSPSTRFTKPTIPYRLVDGTLIANNYTDLTDGTPVLGVIKTESGGAAPRTTFCGPEVPNVILDKIMVWTSTSTTGTLQAGQGTCTNWTETTAGMGAQWAQPNTAAGLTTQCSGGACNGGPYLAPIFCFQQ